MGVVIFIASVFVAFTLWACCKSGADYERFMERTSGMGEQERWQTAYNEYKERFACDRGITIEEATEYQAVKNYKEYLEKEHCVVIKESGCVQ